MDQELVMVIVHRVVTDIAVLLNNQSTATRQNPFSLILLSQVFKGRVFNCSAVTCAKCTRRKTWTLLVIQQTLMALMIIVFGRDFVRVPFRHWQIWSCALWLTFLLPKLLVGCWNNSCKNIIWNIILTIRHQHYHKLLCICRSIILSPTYYSDLFFAIRIQSFRFLSFATRKKCKSVAFRLCPLFHVTEL